MEGTTAQVLAELGHSRWQREDFQQAIIHAQPPSIDLFLERRQDFMRIGKDMIAPGSYLTSTLTGYFRSSDLSL
jgi:hypothetical protein